MHNKKTPEGKGGELSILFGSDNKEEDVEEQVAALLLELAGSNQSI